MRILLLLAVFFCKTALAQDVDLGNEYEDFARHKGSRASSGRSAGSIARASLLYIPNRLLDLIDIFRIDLGVGPSYGAVARVTKWGQAGYRKMAPGSLRIGLRGRRTPAFVEKLDERGIGSNFNTSRKVTEGEVGFGADFFLLGAYAGLSFDELYDFLGGIVTCDPEDDDFR